MNNHYKYIESKLSEKDTYFNPTDKVWEGVQKELWPKRRFAWIWWLIGGMAVVFFGFFFILNVQDMPITENAVRGPELLDANQNLITQPIPSSQMTSLGADQKDLRDEINSSKELKVSKGDNYESSNEELQIDVTHADINVRNHFDKRPATEILFEDQNNESELLGSESQLYIKEGTPNLSINSKPVEPIAGLEFDVRFHQSTYDLKIHPVANFSENRMKNMLSIGGWIGLPFENAKVVNNNPLNETIVNSDYVVNHGIAVNYAHFLTPNLSVFGGIGFANATSRTSYTLSIAYDLQNEIHDASTSSYDNTFVHSLPSAGGDIKSVLTLNRSDQSDVAHNDAIYLDLFTQTKEKILHMPFGVSYYMNPTHDGFYLRAHSDVFISIDKRVETLDLLQHHSIVSVKAGKLEAAQKHHVGLTAGLSVGYSFDLIPNSLSLDVMTGIHQGLTYEVPFRSWQTNVQFSKRW